MNRREFVKTAGLAVGGAVLGSAGLRAQGGNASGPYKISLAQWSINGAFTQRGGTLDNLEFAKVARENGYEAIEYVNQFFMDKAKDAAYLAEMNRVSNGEGITHVLIMIDGEGRIGDPDAAKRNQAVEGHFKWVDAAKTLNCHAIRVNAHGGPGSWEDQLALTTEGYQRIVEYGAQQGINIIIENHGGLSSDPTFLLQMMQRVNNPRAGVLPDFGNFRKGEGEPAEYVDGYEAVRMLMPYVKGLSAKRSMRLANGEQVQVDFERMMRIALDAGFRGYVGIEYGGLEGIRAAREELDAVRQKLAPQYT
jgi:sugar phosphate isomerase/epimerase